MLKLIALLLMTIDHIGASLFPGVLLFRMIGRLSFPMFAYTLSEGYFHTKNRKKYFTRLLIFSLASQVPYMLLFGGYENIKDFTQILLGQPLLALRGNFNIGFTFIFAYLSMVCIDSIKDDSLKFKPYLYAISLLYASEVIGVDYGAYGVASVMVFYAFRGISRKIFLSYMILPVLLAGGTNLGSIILQYLAIVALPIIFTLSKGEIGTARILPKEFFYAFYPAHLLILWIIKII